jgi:hypothetical protein
MNDLDPSKHHLTSSGDQLIKLLRLTWRAAMSAIRSASSDQSFDHARDWCHASIEGFVIEILVQMLVLPTLVSPLEYI